MKLTESIHLQIDYGERVPFGNGNLGLFRSDSIFLPAIFEEKFIDKNAPLMRYLNRRLRDFGTIVTLQRCTHLEHSLRITPVFKLTGNVNGTVLKQYWSDTQHRFFESGTVMPRKSGLEDIISEWRNCLEQNENTI